MNQPQQPTSGETQPAGAQRHEALQQLTFMTEHWRQHRNSDTRADLQQAIREARAAGCTYDAIISRTHLSNRTIARANQRDPTSP